MARWFLTQRHWEREVRGKIKAVNIEGAVEGGEKRIIRTPSRGKSGFAAAVAAGLGVGGKIKLNKNDHNNYNQTMFFTKAKDQDKVQFCCEKI